MARRYTIILLPLKLNHGKKNHVGQLDIAVSGIVRTTGERQEIKEGHIIPHLNVPI